MFARSEAFWAAQASFWGAVSKKGVAKGEGFSPPVVAKAVRKAELWTERGAKYLRGEPRLAAQHGPVRVEVDAQLYRDVLATAERLAPAVVRVWDEHLSGLAFKAFRGWPMATGLSRALIRLEYLAAGDEYVGRVRSDAPYTYFIAGQPHRALIAKPGKALVLQMGRDVLAAGHLDAGGPT